jgi:hypothetical protein
VGVRAVAAGRTGDAAAAAAAAGLLLTCAVHPDLRSITAVRPVPAAAATCAATCAAVLAAVDPRRSCSGRVRAPPSPTQHICSLHVGLPLCTRQP